MNDNEKLALSTTIANALRDHQRAGHGPNAYDPAERCGAPITTMWIDFAERLGTDLAAERVIAEFVEPLRGQVERLTAALTEIRRERHHYCVSETNGTDRTPNPQCDCGKMKRDALIAAALDGST